MAQCYRAILITALALATAGFAGNALACGGGWGDNCDCGGKIYQLEFCWYGDIPSYPAHITVNYWNGSNCSGSGDLKGTSSMDFEWFGTYGENWNFTHDGVAFLTSAWEVNGQLKVCFTMNGYNYGKFGDETSFQLLINGVSSCLDDINTTCDCNDWWHGHHHSDIELNTPLTGIGPGVFYITDGVGGSNCLPASPGCPDYGDGVYELAGEFHVPLNGCVPTNVTFKFYEDTYDLDGTSTAVWNGSGLTNITCQPLACLLDAYMDGDYFVVKFYTYGQQWDGEFSQHSSFKLDLGPCGVFKLMNDHTNCGGCGHDHANIVRLHVPRPLTYGEGYLVYTGGCGACLVDIPIPTEESSFSVIKSLY